MKMSLHRRRQNLSLPPQRRRKPGLLAILIALTTGTMAFAASRITTREPGPAHDDAAVAAANAKTEQIADMRIRAHLKKLQH